MADHSSLVQVANTLEGIEDVSVEGIRQIVEGVRGIGRSEIEQALGDEVTEKPAATQELSIIPDLNEQFRALQQKVEKAFGQTQIEMEKVSQYTCSTELPTKFSLESEKWIEKIYVGLRRVNRYLKKLSKELEPEEPNPSNTSPANH